MRTYFGVPVYESPIIANSLINEKDQGMSVGKKVYYYITTPATPATTDTPATPAIRTLKQGTLTISDGKLELTPKDGDINILVLKLNKDGSVKEVTIDNIADTICIDSPSAAICTNGYKKQQIQDEINALKDAHTGLSEHIALATFRARISSADKKIGFFMRIFFDTLGFKKFLSAEYWAENNGGLIGDYAKSTLMIADSLEPQTWKNNLCNPDSGILFDVNPASRDGDLSDPSAVVYQCTGSAGGCKLVLTFAGESNYYNDTHKIFTVSYLTGPVDRVYNFHVKIKGKGYVSRGTRVNSFDMYNGSIHLSPYTIKNDNLVVVLPIDADFNSVCIVFDEDYPPRDIFGGDSHKEYCRKVVARAYNTGNPHVQEDAQAR
jgi:hypothetical protein